MRRISAAAALTVGLGINSFAIADQSIYPQVAQTEHASPETARLFEGFFAAKSEHDVSETMRFFSPAMLTYTDATLGWPMNSFTTLQALFQNYMPKWPPTALSYPTRILGGPQSALIDVIDTRELFGSELHVLAAVDLKDGKIVRWVDYWDGDAFDATAYQQMRTAQEKFPTDFQEGQVGEDSSNRMRSIALKLQSALAKGDADAAAALFSSAAAVYEDRVLHCEVLGQAAIGRYLRRVLPRVPFGTGATLRHVVGGERGGGFEWIAPAASKQLPGVTALELDGEGKITRLTSVYDGRQLSPELLDELATLSIER
jgi:hypothetical protein